MYGPDDPTTVSSLPTPGPAGTEQYYGPATILTVDQCNMIVQELRNVVTGAGLTPSKTSYTQVKTAIGLLATSLCLPIGGGTLTGGLGIGITPVKPLHVAGAGSAEIEIEATNGLVNYRSWNLLVDGGSGGRQNFTIRQLSDDGITVQLTGLSINGTTGLVTLKVPTQAPLDNSTNVASTAYCDAAVAAAPRGAPAAQFTYQLASGNNSAEPAISATTWTERYLTTTVANSISGCSLSSNQVTLPAGAYLFRAWATAQQSAAPSCLGALRLRDTTHGATLGVGPPSPAPQSVLQNGVVAVDGVFTLSASAAVELDVYFNVAVNAGHALSSGEPEVFVSLILAKVG